MNVFILLLNLELTLFLSQHVILLTINNYYLNNSYVIKKTTFMFKVNYTCGGSEFIPVFL